MNDTVYIVSGRVGVQCCDATAYATYELAYNSMVKEYKEVLKQYIDEDLDMPEHSIDCNGATIEDDDEGWTEWVITETKIIIE